MQKYTKEYLQYNKQNKNSGKTIGRFILNNRHKLSYQAGIDRAKNITVDDSFDPKTIRDQIGTGLYGGVKTITFNGDDTQYVIKQNHNNTPLSSDERFYAHWVPKAYFLRANKEVKDQNGNPALIYEKALTNVRKLYDKLFPKKSQDFSKFFLSYNHFYIKAYLSSLRHGFVHMDMHEGNVLIMKDGRLKFTDYGKTTGNTPESFHGFALSFFNEVKNNITYLKNLSLYDDKSYDAIDNLAKKISNLYTDIQESFDKDPQEYRKKLIVDLNTLSNLNLWKDKDDNNLILSKEEMVKLATSGA